MELRSAARADIQTYAIGLDLGAMALEVAQRGFSSMLSNRMAQLGRWSFDGPSPSVRLVDDLVVQLLERERSSRFERAVIGVASPVWFGIHERTRLADMIDPRRRHVLVACSTPLAAAVGSSLAGETPLQPELVLSLDLEVGCSASIVEIGPTTAREWCSIGLSPQQLRGESSDGVGGRRGSVSILPGSRHRDRAVTELAREAGHMNCLAIDRVVVVGDHTTDEIDEIAEMLRSAHEAWSGRPIEVSGGRAAVARGAAFLADPSGGRVVFGLVGADSVDRDHGSGGDADPGIELAADEIAAFEVVGCVGRRLGVLMEDREGRPLVHPVVERCSVVPSVHEQLFDLGPDDGSEVFLDLYEQHGIIPSDEVGDHRVVGTAHLRPGSRRRAEVTVTFGLGLDGRFEVGPPDMWTITWHAAQVDVVAVPGPLEPPDERSARTGRSSRSDSAERSTVRPLIASWTVAPGSETDQASEPDDVSEPATPQPHDVGIVVDEPIVVDSTSTSTPDPDPDPTPDPTSTPDPTPDVSVPDEPVRDDPALRLDVWDVPIPARAPETSVESRSASSPEPRSEPGSEPGSAPGRDLESSSEGRSALDEEPGTGRSAVLWQPPLGRPSIPTAHPRSAEGPDTLQDPDERGRRADTAVVDRRNSPAALAGSSVQPNPGVPAALPPTPAIAAALQRCERLLSHEVGQMVSVRSVFALLDCPDDASTSELIEAADRLERSIANRDDDLGDAVRSALAAMHRSIGEGSDDWYFGGTLADIDTELGRVVEHLMVVVGVVSMAEQRRLVHDGQLLGLAAERARRTVHDLVIRAQEDRFHAQLPDGDACRTVHLHPELGRFVLDAGDTSGSSGTGHAGPDHRSGSVTRDAVRMRVLLDLG